MIATDAPDGAGPLLPPPFDPLALSEELLDAALSALRQGTLELVVRQRPLAARWLMRRFLPVVEGTFGDAWSPQAETSEAPAMLLRWLITQLRPDLEPRLDRISDEAWLNLVAWRPMIALMCHVRLAAVPAFPARYRKRADEAAVDNLCGLWDVGPSTFYRYVERGKHQMAQIATESPPGVARRLSLRRFVAAELALRGLWNGETGRVAWHRAQVHRLRQRGDAVSALWHALQAADADLATDTMRSHAAALAGAPETDALVERVAALPMGARARFDLWAARAALARTRNAVDRELAAHERALHVATEAGDALLLGMAYGALGRFHESRDADRAFACYEDSARYLLSADPQHNDPDAVAQYMTTLVRLAWMHVLRNHPQAKAMLERAEQLSRAQPVPEELIGMLEQSWGEYWRIAGDLKRALQAKHRALNVFERLGDQRSVLVTFLNLISLHGEARELDKAELYARKVAEAAAKTVVEPAILVSTHGNLATAYLLAGRYDSAVDEYRASLDRALRADLRLHANRARVSLASAYFSRCVETHDPEFERLGDAELAAFFQSPLSERTPSLTESARNLKAEVFGARPERSIDHLLSDEAAEHLDEMAEIQRQRSALQTDEAPEARVRAHLAIAKAYLQVSVKEREAARQLIERHGLDDRFADDLGRLLATFDRQLSREQRVAAQWSKQAADLLDDPRRAALIECLLRDGSINKSAYADLNAVSPATASKHLALLTERGLLTRSGQGPSTKYLLSG